MFFFVTLVLFLSIPQLFDYKKREETIKKYISKNYGIQINELKNIEFNSFPVTYMKLESLLSNLSSKILKLKLKN